MAGPDEVNLWVGRPFPVYRLSLQSQLYHAYEISIVSGGSRVILSMDTPFFAGYVQ